MKYPDELVGWLFDVANSLDWRVSIRDILETERTWPGLMDDLSVESWQRHIVKEQISSTLPSDSETDN